MVRKTLIWIFGLLLVSNLQAQTYFATTRVSRIYPYVGQEVKATITTYTSSSFSPPLAGPPIKVDTILTKNALIVPFTDQIVSGTAEIKGLLYSTLTLTCKIYPYTTGTVIFPKVHIVASIILKNKFLGTDKDIYTKPVTIEVKPLPKGDASSAFVSNRVILTEQWTQLKDTMMTGTVAYRKLTATAYNTLPYFIDSIQVTPAGFASDYLKTDTLMKRVNNTSVLSERQDVYLYLFTEEGSYELPSATITYFNPFLKQYKTAKTAPKKLVVIPNPNQAILSTLADSLNTAYKTASEKNTAKTKKAFSINKKTAWQIAFIVVFLIVAVWMFVKLIEYIRMKRVNYKASPAWVRDQMYKVLKKGDRDRFINLFYLYLLRSRGAVSMKDIEKNKEGGKVKEDMTLLFAGRGGDTGASGNSTLEEDIRRWDKPEKPKKKKHHLKQLYPK